MRRDWLWWTVFVPLLVLFALSLRALIVTRGIPPCTSCFPTETPP
jgi:hypothetical protein